MADTTFEEDQMSVAERRAAEALIVDVDGFEGPLDLLLTLGRTQKVDLRKTSVLQLARQLVNDTRDELPVADRDGNLIGIMNRQEALDLLLGTK